MRHLIFLLLTALLFLTMLISLQAADPRFPDWPCAQIKVPEISLAAVWSGPSVDGERDAWQRNSEIKDLVARIAARRTSLEDAQIAITEFISGSPAEKQEKAKLLFSGLFDMLNRQRSEVINGIERHTRKQRRLVERIRANTLRLRELESAASRDETRITELANQVEWDTRIFEDRRKSTRYVCEVPIIIERRLFALGRAIQQSLE